MGGEAELVMCQYVPMVVEAGTAKTRRLANVSLDGRVQTQLPLVISEYAPEPALSAKSALATHHTIAPSVNPIIT